MVKREAIWPPEDVKSDCKWFRGDVPCFPHKQHDYFCADCPVYEAFGKRVLIVKLGAAGDVIRTTPLLRKIRKQEPNAEITWLTYSPDLVPRQWVDRVLFLDTRAAVWLKAHRFYWLSNLDKDMEAIALAEEITAAKKNGFGMDRFGKARPFGNSAESHKWMTGLWDSQNRANRKSYMEEILEICGYSFEGEEYILEKTSGGTWPGIDKEKKVIGLNTGCGERWITRRWSDEKWIGLAKKMLTAGYEVVLLGGPQEHEKNLLLAAKSGAKYLGHFELQVFVDLMDQCDLVVSQVTMAMHVAIALKKKLILLNNIFNAAEFYLYGRGVIIQPSLDCLGCYKQKFDDRCPVENCMELITIDRVLDECTKLMRER